MQNENNKNWDIVITPKGASAGGGFAELWAARDLVTLFVHRDFVSQYKQTVLGPLWHLVQPLVTTLIFTLVFGRIVSLPTDGLPHFLFYFSGIVIWTYLAGVVSATSTTLSANAHLFGKVYFPRLAIPVATAISKCIGFVIQFLLLLVFVIYFLVDGTNFSISWMVLLLPLLIVMTAFLGLGVGILVSAASTKYRDLAILIAFGIQLWMFATPIVYPLSSVPESWQLYASLNPATSIVESFRFCLFGSGTINGSNLLLSFIVTCLLFFFSVSLFRRVEKDFMDTV